MKKDIKVLIGKAVDTKKDINIDFFNSPHLLVGGSTGSGKSNFLLSIISSLAKRFTPKELRLVLADPKRVEFSRFRDSQYLAKPVIMTTKEALDAVKYLEAEMESRYEDLQRAGSMNIVEYNKKKKNKMAYIFFIADEISDFMVDNKDKANKKITEYMIRLAQMARAVGIHMILSTSSPHGKVIPVMLRANLPMRLAFKMSTKKDSMFLLDRPGAEKLLGNGDGLYFGPTGRDPIKIQTPLITEKEMIKKLKVCNFQTNA